jgi:hypothetical protein
LLFQSLHFSIPGSYDWFCHLDIAATSLYVFSE